MNEFQHFVVVDSVLPSNIEELLHRMMDTTDEIELAAIYDTIEGLEGEAVQYLELLANEWRNNNARIAGCKAELQRLEEHHIRLEKRTSRIEYVALQLAKLLPEQKMVTDTYKVQIKKNPPAVNVYDESQVPNAYKSETVVLNKMSIAQADAFVKILPDGLLKKTEISIHKSEIADAIKNGAVVAGAELTQGERLVIE